MNIRNLSLLSTLIAAIGLIFSGQATAQTFTTLHSFTAVFRAAPGTNSDGAGPSGPLALFGDSLYGTAAGGGSENHGTVFAINIDGTGFRTLHNFAAADDGASPIGGMTLSGQTLYGAVIDETTTRGSLFAINVDGTGFTILHRFAATNSSAPDAYTNSDGAYPQPGLVVSDNTVYGTAAIGGTFGAGTVFKVNTDGSGFSTLHTFVAVNPYGAGPIGGLASSGGTLFGTTMRGGNADRGTVFSIKMDGSGFTILHSFMDSDGDWPIGLTLSGQTLYGIAGGGRNGDGTLFAINLDGTGFTNLYNFTGNDPYSLRAELIISGNRLYGTASQGLPGYGSVVAMNTDGTGLTVLHGFSATLGLGFTNSDGAHPHAGLVLAGATLYGTALDGGTSGNGTIFKINTDGTGFTNLYSFTPNPFSLPYNNTDGANPTDLIILSNRLYGAASRGGSLQGGTLFAINTDGTGFTTLHSFPPLQPLFGHPCSDCPKTNSDGAGPSGLTWSGSALWGTAATGGSHDAGTLFRVNRDGTGFTNLHNFGYTDGANPSARLVLGGNTVYGATGAGGSSVDLEIGIRGFGTIFAINTDGTGFRTLYSFSGGTNGSGPNALVLSGQLLYGTTGFGGSGGPLGNGTVFKLNNNGTAFTILHDFGARGTNSSFIYTHIWGAFGLILSENVLYGKTATGGASGKGTLFKMNTDGSDFVTLHNFAFDDRAFVNGELILSRDTLYGTRSPGDADNGALFAIKTDGTGFTSFYSFARDMVDSPGLNSDGAYPGGLTLSRDTLYGTANIGGSAGVGTVFSLSFAPKLTISAFETNLVLTWPANYAGFNYTGYILESTENLDSPAVWTGGAEGAVVANGRSTVTRLLGTQQFYRLHYSDCAAIAGPWPGPHWVLDLDSCNWVFNNGPGPGD